MATTNLISKSLGDILVQTGNGTPDHTAPLGSHYTDQDDGNLWKNVDGGTSWQKFSTVAYGEAFYQDNTTPTNIIASNTWYAVGNNFTEGDTIGFSASTDTLVLETGYDGDYEIRGNVTIDYNAGAANYEVGLSFNGAIPVAGEYNGAYIDATYTREHIGVQTIRSLTGGTTIEFAVRNLTSTADVEIRHAHVFARRIG